MFLSQSLPVLFLHMAVLNEKNLNPSQNLFQSCVTKKGFMCSVILTIELVQSVEIEHTA